MIRKLAEFILFSHIFIGIGAAALNYVCQIFLLGEWRDPQLSLFCFGATWLSYLFHRFNVYQKRTELKDNEVMQWTKQNMLVLKSIFPILALACLYQYFQFARNTQLLLLGIGFISFTYSSSFFGFKLRDIPFAKIFLISLNWAACTAGLVLTEYGNISLTQSLNCLVHIFMLIFLLTISFDIRDLAFDRKEKLDTIVTRFSLNSVKLLCLVIGSMWSVVAGMLLRAIYPESYAFLLAPCAYIIGVMLLVLASNPKRSEMFYLGLIDGCIILWALVVYAVQYFHVVWG